LSTRSGPRAVCRIVRRSGLAARPAGPVEAGGRFVSPFGSRASRARRLNEKEMHTNGARWVGRSRMNRCGFWVFRSRLRSARDGVRLSRRARSCLGLWASLRFDGCDRLGVAGTSGRSRVVRRVPPFARPRVSRGRIRSWVSRQKCRPRDGPGKQYQFRRLSSSRFARRPFALARRDAKSLFAADVPSAC